MQDKYTYNLNNLNKKEIKRLIINGKAIEVDDCEDTIIESLDIIEKMQDLESGLSKDNAKDNFKATKEMLKLRNEYIELIVGQDNYKYIQGLKLNSEAKTKVFNAIFSLVNGIDQNELEKPKDVRNKENFKKKFNKKQ